MFQYKQPNFKLQKSLKYIKVFSSARRYKQTSLCTCRFKCYSLSVPSTHRHYTNHTIRSVCRSTQFVTSINNVVTKRGSRSASCIVDVDCLKVWVRLLVKGTYEHYRDEHYRHTHLKCLVRGFK